MNVFDSKFVFLHAGIINPVIMKKVLILCIVSILGAFASNAADKKAVDVSKIPPAVDKKGVTYAADIKPLFEKSCIKCHGTEKQKGKLRLDTLEATLKGGEDGKVVQPGKSAESMLVHNIAHVGDEDLYMPPPDNKDKIPPMTKEEIGLIRAWIDQGAK